MLVSSSSKDVVIREPRGIYIHCKNIWVTFLGCLLHQYNQRMLPNRFTSLRSFFSYSSQSLFSEDLFGYIPGISTTNHATKEPSRGRCLRSKKQQISPEMLIYMLSERLFYFNKEQSFSTPLCSNCKHSLNCTCHTHKRNATEVIKIWLK